MQIKNGDGVAEARDTMLGCGRQKLAKAGEMYCAARDHADGRVRKILKYRRKVAEEHTEMLIFVIAEFSSYTEIQH